MTGRKYSKEWVGRRYGRLTIVDYVKGGRFICKCDCGNTNKVVPMNLLNGKVVSCGCYSKETASRIHTKHGGHGTRLYGIYRGMLDRCYRKTTESYVNYGGRGIVVCDEWLNDFASFREWALNNGYSDDLTIDRIDNDGNYEPSNCRWATMLEQANNRRPTRPRRFWTIDGITKSEIEWCKEYGISVPTARYRVDVKGMEPLEALTTELSQGRPRLS